VYVAAQVIADTRLGATLGATGMNNLASATNGAGRSSQVTPYDRTDTNEPGHLMGTYG
jgi:hypothetical protein